MAERSERPHEAVARRTVDPPRIDRRAGRAAGGDVGELLLEEIRDLLAKR